MKKPTATDNSWEIGGAALVSVPLQDLPNWSIWPARILELEKWQKRQRAVTSVIAEYDGDKYARCQRFLDEHPSATFEDVKQFEFGASDDQQTLVSIGDDLFSTDLRTARRLHMNLIRQRIPKLAAGVRFIVELGAGYGFNLDFLRQILSEIEFIGGELSERAVRLGNALAQPTNRVSLRPFNFCDEDSYRFLDSLHGGVLVFTCHAVEQLPSAAAVIENLSRFRDRIRCVVHFEPGYELHSGGLLGLLRRRYAQINDYNRDLINVLSSAKFVDIQSSEPDVFGLNPLNPTSVVQWSFC
jgi:hypothetical protein